jgi:lysophospholipase L1-like esterase
MLTLHQLAKTAVFFVSLLGCTTPSSTSMTTPTNALSFLSLGDSYTIGEGVEPTERWSVQFARQLRRQNRPVADPDIIARTGWTTAELQAAIRASGNTKQYDLVSLLIGVNNQYRGGTALRQLVGTYEDEFGELLQTAIRYAKGRPDRVMVLSIPDWGQSPYAEGRDKALIAKEIDAFNAAARALCQQQKVAFIDITPLTRSAAGDATQFANDGLHYSGKQMKQWAEAAGKTMNVE